MLIRYIRFAAFGAVFFAAACYTPPKTLPPFSSARASKAQAEASFGIKNLPTEVVELRKQLKERLDFHVSQSLLDASLFDSTKACTLIRLGPGPSFSQALELVFSKREDLIMPHGMGIKALITKGIDETESQSLSLWYDFHGTLMATVTLQSNHQESEEAGNKEEFFIFSFLPQTKQWVAEGQRLFGQTQNQPSFYLPKAIMLDREEPYGHRFFATAYLLCN